MLKHLPILTIIAGDFARCNTVLDSFASILAERSIEILAVSPHGNGTAGLGRATTIKSSSYDTVFLDAEDCSGLEEKGSGDRLDCLLSHYCLGYDLIFFCRIDHNLSEEIEIIEGKDRGGKKLFQFKADDNPALLAEEIYNWLFKQMLAIPVWGCVLIGGKSSRMGRPKHLIEDADGITWGERIVSLLSGVTDKVILSGGGEVPQSLAHIERLVDIADARGPLAGILAAMRWNPHVSFVVTACDMPDIDQESLQWLLGRRRPGRWGIVPIHPQSRRYEPLFAHYDFRSRVLFEKLLQQGSLRPNHICKSEKIETPVVPSSVADSWRNCNTPEDLSG